MPAIGLACETREANIMDRPPRNPKNDLLVDRGLLSWSYPQVSPCWWPWPAACAVPDPKAVMAQLARGRGASGVTGQPSALGVVGWGRSVGQH
jgi:hypothetical protein